MTAEFQEAIQSIRLDAQRLVDEAPNEGDRTIFRQINELFEEFYEELPARCTHPITVKSVKKAMQEMLFEFVDLLEPLKPEEKSAIINTGWL